MNNKLVLLSVMMLLSVVSISATSGLGTIKQGNCISLYQFCPSCSYVNLTAIKFPNGTVNDMNLDMSKSNSNYNYTYCTTKDLGEYFYTVCGDKGGTATCEEISFSVAKSGLNGTNTWQVISITALLLIFSILVMYKSSKILGGISFIIIGVVLMFIEPFLGYAGLLIMFSGILISILDLISKKPYVNSGRWLKR